MLVRYIEDNEPIEENNDDSLTFQELAPMAYLALLVGGRISHTFPLRGEIEVGREKTNAIVVADKKVSRRHARLSPIDNSFIIIDQGSANGTYVNGILIAQPTRLQNNDKIGIGDATFLFTTGQPAAQVINSSPAQPTLSPPFQVGSDRSLMVADSNRSIWLAIGCMAVAIIALLVILAVILGVFMGRTQLGLVLLWLL